MQFLYLHVTFKNCPRDQTIPKLWNPSPTKILKYSIHLPFIIHSSTWPDTESLSPIILSEIFIVDENHLSSFLRKVMFWTTLFHTFHLYSYKTVMQIQSSTNDLTTSNLDTEKSQLDVEHPMHLLLYLVPRTSSQTKKHR